MSYNISFFKNVARINRSPSNSKFFIRTVTHCLRKVTDAENPHRKCVLPQSHQVLNHKSSCLSSLPNSRLLSNKKDHTTQDKNVNSEYVELYLFEKIRSLRVLGRFSKYSCLSFMLGVPVCVMSTLSNVMPIESSKLIISVLSFYFAIFTGQSFLFSSRILAKMMINEDESMIKISHLSLLGDRRDVFVKPSEIVPFTDVNSEVLVKKMAFIKLKNSNKQFIFMPDLGGIDTNFEVIELILSGGLKEEHE